MRAYVSVAMLIVFGSYCSFDTAIPPVVDARPPVVDARPDARPNIPPIASFTMDPDCTTDDTTQITFTSTSTDGDGDPLNCSWTFTSGTPDNSAACTTGGVTFPSVSPYNVILVVDDERGGQDATTMQIAPCP